MLLDNIVQCQMCRKPFQRYGSGKICGECLEQIEIDFRKIRDYMYDNPGRISVGKLVEETEVPEKIVLHLIRENRLEIMDSSGGGLVCQMCKTPISSGAMCEKCASKLAQSLDKAVAKPTKPESAEEAKRPIASKMTGKMHTYRKEED